MKSIFQEGNSLSNAVQKAWESMGSPESFSVKILRKGEYNFFGFCKVPFAISLSTTLGQEHKTNKQTSFREPVKKSSEPVVPSAANNHSKPVKTNVFPKAKFPKEAQTEYPKNDSKFPRKNLSSTTDQESSSEVVVKSENRFESEKSSLTWTLELQASVQKFLTEMLVIAGAMDPKFETLEKNGEMLKLKVMALGAENSFDDVVFQSLAPLLVRMAKKENSVSEKGLRLEVTFSKE